MISTMKSMLAMTSLLLACAGTAGAQWGALTQDPGPQGCFSQTGLGPCDGGRALSGPTSMAISKDGKYVYVASQAAGAVAVLARDKTTGTLSQLPGPEGCISADGSGGQCAAGRALDYSLSMALSPNGKQLYVASYYSSSVAVLTRDRRTGALTQLPGPEGCISADGSGGQCASGRALLMPRSVAISPNGRHVYVASGDGYGVAVLQRNSLTGALTQLPGPEGCISAGGMGGCSSGRALDFPWSVALSKDAKHVYVASFYSNAVAVLQRNPTTGALTQRPGPEGCIGSSGLQCTDGRALVEPRSVTVSPDGKHVYAASGSQDTIAVLQRDPTTGALTQLPGPEGCINAYGSGACARVRALDLPTSVAFSKDGKNVYVASYYGNAVAVLQREPTSGGLTQRDGVEGCIGEVVIDDQCTDPGCNTDYGCTDGRALRDLVSVAVSKDGKQVYAVSAFNSAVAVLQRAK